MTIPLVGQPFVVHELQVCATMTCKCASDNVPFLLLGTGVRACPHCRKGYVITKLTFDRNATELTGEVSCILASEKPGN
jgi:hypothetical protein